MENVNGCAKVIHFSKVAKTLKNQVIHKVIHIIHMDNDVDELIYIMEIKTNVLVIVLKMKKSTGIVKKVLTFVKSKYYRIFAENITT